MARDAETAARRHELAVRREQERKQREQERTDKRTEHKRKEKEKAFESLISLPNEQQETRLGELAKRLDEDVAVIRDHFTAFVGMQSWTASTDSWNVELWPDPVETQKLLQTISAKIRKYIVLRPEALIATALWTMTAWANEGATHSPILAALLAALRAMFTRNHTEITSEQVVQELVADPNSPWQEYGGEAQSPKTKSRRCCETMIFVLSSFIRLSEPTSRGTVTGQRTSRTRLRVSCPTSRTSEHSSAGATGCDVRMFGCLPLDGPHREGGLFAGLRTY